MRAVKKETFLKSHKESNWQIVFLVGFALFLDNVLLTAIVPIMPEFLYSLEHPSSGDTISQDDTEEIHDVSSTTSQYDATNTQGSSTEGKVSSVMETSTNTVINTVTDYIRPDENKTTLTNNTQVDQTVMTNQTFIESSRNASKNITSQYEDLKKKNDDILHETSEIGILFASKPFVHLLTIPVIGLLMSRVSCDIFLLAGYLILFVSTLIFAFGNSYIILFVARSIQGVGSACVSLAGISIIAEIFHDNAERGNAMAYALSGIALGTLVGPTYGGVLYELFGKSEPFILLALLSLAGACYQLCISVPYIKKQKFEFHGMLAVILDPYILLACAAITVANMGLALMESILPVWMIDTMQARRWQQGAVFLPESIAYLICTYYIGSWGNRYGRWFIAMLGFLMLGFSYMLLPLAQSFLQTFLPMTILGFSIGLVDGAMVPELGHLADLRHAAIYGAVYALEEIAFCLGNMITPALGGVLTNSVGFKWTSIGIAVLTFMYAPCMYFIRNPATKEENEVLLVL